jgi:hypothetical protein
MAESRSVKNYKEYLKGRSKLKFAILIMQPDKLVDFVDDVVRKTKDKNSGE